MAKKSRTPAPPRPVQAPRKRVEARDPRRTRLWIAIALGILLLGAAAGGIAYAMTRGGGDPAAAGGVCEVQTLKSQGQGHVNKLPADFKPVSYPRATGPHSPQTVVFGEYTEPVAELNLVHNLEHGAVAIQYGKDVSDDTVRRLKNWYRIDPRGLIVAPFGDTPKAEKYADKIVMTAWLAKLANEDDPTSRVESQEGKLAVCSGFDEEAFNDFLDKYRGKGPERFPLDDLQPGSG